MNNSNILSLAEKLHDFYKTNVDKLFANAFKTSPEAFRFYNLKDVKLNIVQFDKSLFPRNNILMYIIQKKDSNLEIEYNDLTAEEYYVDFADHHTSEFKEAVLDNEGIIDKRDIIFVEELSYLENRWNEDNEVFKAHIDIHNDLYFTQMQRLASQEAREYQTHINQSANYYARNAYKYAYSALDLGPVIEKVNDADFEYQLDEAIAAYDHSLYMASTACLGVSLETLCKILLEKNGKAINDNEPTMLSKLADRLYRGNIISKRFKARLDVCYKLRNLSSHTSPGMVIKEDCHTIIGTIHEIVNTYFD
ncbi:hypothetical protein CHH64_07420 [Terribacillus saccharophilus]|uniref:DUF4145 domain-containing protein n=2 Tax=Terribacillus saccharophilus TaxID=361277 RepID=A0A268AC19_9BACI|nr:hypothetical protein CHH64_07420 [Terribacillus saccharophilus]